MGIKNIIGELQVNGKKVLTEGEGGGNLYKHQISLNCHISDTDYWDAYFIYYSSSSVPLTQPEQLLPIETWLITTNNESLICLDPDGNDNPQYMYKISSVEFGAQFTRVRYYKGFTFADYIFKSYSNNNVVITDVVEEV